MTELRLRYIARGDFRKNEHTLLNEILPQLKDLKLARNDCVLFVSNDGKIIRFVFGFLATKDVRDETYRGPKLPVQILPSRTYRMTGGGTFNPLMIVNYAEELGLSMAGLKRFEEYYAKDREERSAFKTEVVHERSA